jgi:hypothetical protein
MPEWPEGDAHLVELELMKRYHPLDNQKSNEAAPVKDQYAKGGKFQVFCSKNWWQFRTNTLLLEIGFPRKS